MKIALIQQSAGCDREENIECAIESMRTAADAGAALVCFAELAIDRFFPQCKNDPQAAGVAESIPGPTSDRIGSESADLGLVTVFNQYELGSDNRYYDSSPVFDADGALLGVTRMMHITEYTHFHEQGYYAKGDVDASVYDTAVGRVGVAICYDRHYPEYMRRLGELGAELVVIPQAGAIGEWPEGLFEAELQVSAFQNGYFAALCNRVGQEEKLTFAGDSFVVNPDGVIVARGPELEDAIVLADIDLKECASSTARQLFWRDRRPRVYAGWGEPDPPLVK